MAAEPRRPRWTVRVAPLGLATLAALLIACEPALVEPTVPTRTPAATPELTAPPVRTPTPPRSPAAAGPTPTARPPAAPPRGDFGDAPDGSPAGYVNSRIVGRFPTRFATLNGKGPGAHVLRPGVDRLGASVSLEAGGNDPADDDGSPNLVSGDGGDDGVRGLIVDLGATPPLARLTVQVGLSAEVAAGPRYINVLIDRNRDGRWEGDAADARGSEWVTRNWRVQAAGSAVATLRSEPFVLLDNDVLPDRAWMRVVLSRTPIESARWDGSGRWTFGEVEDYQLGLPVAAGSETDPAPALTVLTCPAELFWPAATLIERLGCTLTNVGAAGRADVRAVRSAGRSRVVPEAIAVDEIPSGGTRLVSFALVRAETATRLRIRGPAADSRSTVVDGVVRLGIERADHTVAVAPRDLTERMFHADPAADYFSVSTGAPVEGYGFADIRRVAAGRARLDADVLAALRQGLTTIESIQLPQTPAEFVVVIVAMADEIPLDDPSLGWQFGVALQGNDDPSDDWRPLVGGFDLFQGTDQWYEVIYRPDLTPAWRVQRRDAAAPTRAVATSAMALIDGPRLILLIPSGEIVRAPEDLRLRVTTFVHDRDDPLGADQPSMADVFPALSADLVAFGAVRAPRG